MGKMLKPIIIVITISIMVSGVVLAEDVCTSPVKTTSGLVSGAEDGGTATCVWRGIPYAAAPVGELRWKAPQKAPPWSDVRDAARWGAQCMQKNTMPSLGTPGDMSEDCLFLNVWRPRKAGKFPVMVWIHGGGYHLGTGSVPLFFGDRLAKAGDVVVVTINYRLNIFGFMAHPSLREEDPNKSTGGYGTMDQAFALQWVHDNIENFGGDPENVTIFGESAGGWSVCTLVATPLAEGLFHRAIIESGGCEASRDLEESYKLTKKEFVKLGCDFNNISCARNMPAKKLLEEGTETIIAGFDFLPAHDGYVLKDTPLGMIKSGNYNKVPVMAGTNLDEFAGVLKLVPKIYLTRPGKYKKRLIELGATEQEAQRLVELYPLKEFGNRPVVAYGRMFGADAVLLAPTVRALRALAAQGGAAYFYRLEYAGMKYQKYMGVFHGAELPFVFNSLDRGNMKSLFNEKNISEARELSRVIQGYWINFAGKGDPNGEGLPGWTAFTQQNQRVQVLNTSVKNAQFEFSERCAFWDGFSKKYLVLLDDLLWELNKKYHTVFENMSRN